MRDGGRTQSRLSRLSLDRASGELIYVSDSVEIHVFFQHGNIAWATNSLRPLEFTRYLLESAEIDPATFREILESCRREKRPLGETLIAWGVATKEEVRAALRHQIEGALSGVVESEASELLFLKRSAQYADYDDTLTFDLADLTYAPSDLPRTPSVVVPSSAPPPSDAPMQLRIALDGVRWVEEVRAGQASARIPGDLFDNTLRDGARLVTLQSSTETLAGVLLTPERSLFCLVEPAVTIGAITTLLGSLSTIPAVAPASSPLGVVPPRAIGRAPDDRVASVFGEFLERASDVRAVFLTTRSKRSDSIFGITRGSIAGEDLEQLVLRRGRAFTASVVPRDAEPPRAADVEGTTSFRGMTVEATCVLFATEIVVDGATHLVWVVLDDAVSKGVAWGYLTSLGRTLARALRQESVEEAEPHRPAFASMSLVS